jgi:DNA (cytosine-5)-methyltransferase 1
MNKKQKFTINSLFCGCGGLDLGFEWAGFQVKWANDNDKWAIESYKANFPFAHVNDNNIQNVDLDEIPSADILIGGYPCQGFSLGGSRRLDDDRNKLYVEYAHILQAKQPLMFVAENVKGLRTMANGEVLRQMLCEFEEKGYEVNSHFCNAKNYGVPQDRERIFIIGTRKDICNTFTFPTPTHGNNLQPLVTLRNTIGKLHNPGEWFDGHYTSRYMSRQRKRGWDEVSFCIQASAEQVALHPSGEKMQQISKDLWQFAGKINRRLSLLECKLIQTFPANYHIFGNLKEQYKQIGNAVPPMLSLTIAKQVKKTLFDEFKCEN